MPEFEIRKTSESHSSLTFLFASSTKEQEFTRIFPDPMPETHELRYRWENDPNPKRPRRLIVVPVRRDGTVEQEAPQGEQPAANATRGDPAGGLDEVPHETKPPVTPNPVPPPEGVVARLEKLSEADLETEAATVGVSVFANGKSGKKLSKAQLVAAVAAKASTAADA